MHGQDIEQLAPGVVWTQVIQRFVHEQQEAPAAVVSLERKADGFAQDARAGRMDLLDQYLHAAGVAGNLDQFAQGRLPSLGCHELDVVVPGGVEAVLLSHAGTGQPDDRSPGLAEVVEHDARQ